jgi:hypothetical protein
MASVLGIDAVWAEKGPSGVALLKGFPGAWQCIAVTVQVGVRGRGGLLYAAH